MGKKNIIAVAALGALIILAFILISWNKNAARQGNRDTFSDLEHKEHFDDVIGLKDYIFGLKGSKLFLYGKGNKKLWSYNSSFDYPEMEKCHGGVILINAPYKEENLSSDNFTDSLSKLCEKESQKTQIIFFNNTGLIWKDSIYGIIMRTKTDSKGYVSVMYKIFSGNKSTDYLKVYSKDGKVKFQKSFNGAFLADGGISPDSELYYAVLQAPVATGFDYKVIMYYPDGSEKDKSIVKDEAYIGGDFYGDAFICADTSFVRGFKGGRNIWSIKNKGNLLKLINNNKYFVYAYNDSSSVLSSKNYIAAVDDRGKCIYRKIFTQN